ncbi:DUF2213 domain-containing protein [Enterobacter bugandensis]|nr:DUF2213 domain-containing protein [Enterobacter bugandensis]
MSFTELDAATRIRDGTLLSPFKFSNVWLVDLRITGTGAAYRSKYGEHVWRNPDEYLNNEFLSRCNGLPVIIDHPDNPMIDDTDFRERVIGAVMLPYIKGDEVWAVSRVYCEDIIPDIVAGLVSTSPGVVFNETSGNITIETSQEGESVLIEGKPFLIDHIALVTEKHGIIGVWDKNQVPEGITTTNTGNLDMNEEELKKLIEESFSGINAKLDSATKTIDSVVSRMDSMEQERKDEAEAAEKERKDAAETAEKERNDAAAAEEQARKDQEAADEKERQDAADAEEQAKKDAAEAEMKADTQARADNAYASFGQRARAPMAGESAADYRKRLLKGMQQYSDEYKSVDISAIHDAALLDIAERKIYIDAARYARSGAGLPNGHLRMTTRKDEAGRTVRDFHGDIRAFLAPITGGFHQFSGLKNGDK